MTTKFYAYADFVDGHGAYYYKIIFEDEKSVLLELVGLKDPNKGITGFIGHRCVLTAEEFKKKYREWVKPIQKVKKSGWILVLKDKNTSSVLVPTGRVKTTIADAEGEFISLKNIQTYTDYQAVRIEWEEEVD